ncbi:MAG: hypothetical protein B6U89_06305 [Desulfurococcales archaeon ex4484_58]|nr:MAG: hypothetical protein B6U89_06305 [Desulfurococcales archaeon ex4484_58]
MKSPQILGLPLIILILISMLAVTPAITITQNSDSAGASVNVTARVTFEELLDLAYTVRNVSYPMLNWSMSYNSTLAHVILARGDNFLERAVNLSSTNTTRAKIFAMIAAIYYAHAPVTAYQVLGKTIRDNLSENHTITNDTVEAVLDKALEVKNVLLNAIDVAENYNVTKPALVDILIANADSKINYSLTLLQMGYVRYAFRAAVHAYHIYVKAYGVLIKAVFIEKLDLPRRYGEPLTPKLLIIRFEKKMLERLMKRLPRWIIKDIIKKIRAGNITSWEELREEIKKKIELSREIYRNVSIRVVTNVLTTVIIYSVYDLPPDNTTREGVLAWLQNKGLTIGPTAVIRMRELRRYLKEFVTNISETYNVSGLRLLNLSIYNLELQIEDETGIDVNLTIILKIVLRYTGHHIFGGPGPRHH